ncbi:MAG TPA: c-type cytochrome [Gammaproteobacteria bacterium]|nr:c-type cytochrome [Gammaproteobacteria bacterium]
MRNYIIALLTVFALFMVMASGTASAAAPAAFHECEACHGTNGVSTDKSIPIIAGMSAFYLDGELQAYQKGLRPCPKTKYPKDAAKPATDMCDMAKKLSPADSTAIDKYLASQPFVPATQSFDPKLAAIGKQIHSQDCELCHTDGGSVADDDAGILAGQWTPYLQETFKEYVSGKRVAPDKMKPKIAALTPDKINALLQYYASEGKK